MAQNAAEVDIAVTGNIFSLPKTDVLPDDIYAEPVGAVEHGYANEDGVETSGSVTVSNILAWQNAAIVRTTATEASVTVAFTLIQDNEANRELYYGGAKDSTTGAYHWNPINRGGRKAFVIDGIDLQNGTRTRFYFPDAEITEMESVTFNSTTPIQYGLTITAYFDTRYGANMLRWDGPLEEGAS